MEAKVPKSYRHSTFEHYDAITFVVIVLNFLREDASPLLTPTAVQEGAPEGLSGDLRYEQSTHRRTESSIYIPGTPLGLSECRIQQHSYVLVALPLFFCPVYMGSFSRHVPGMKTNLRCRLTEDIRIHYYYEY